MIDKYTEEFQKVIHEVLSQMDLEEAQFFLNRLTEKLDEQKCTQENIRSS